MNLNDLKPAWKRFQLQHGMQAITQDEILSMLERAEGIAVSKTNRLMMHSIMFIVLTLCCQGG